MLGLMQNSVGLADRAMDNAVIFLVGQLILFVLTLVGSLAIGKRFLNQEYPGFVLRVETSMKTLESKLLSEIDALRRDVIGLREQHVDRRIHNERMTETLGNMDRRLSKVEDKLDRGEQTWGEGGNQQRNRRRGERDGE
jgi:hypothetical protein